jgi:hypothetical protein
VGAASVNGYPSPLLGGADAVAAHSGREPAPLETRSWAERRLGTETCTLPGRAALFSVVTEGPAQISGNQVYGPSHIGGQMTSNPRKPFYNQKVSPQRALRAAFLQSHACGMFR